MSTIEHISILKTNKNSLLTKNKKRKFADLDFNLKYELKLINKPGVNHTILKNVKPNHQTNLTSVR